MRYFEPKAMKICDLKLGDTVRLFDDAFGHGVVHQIKDGLIYVFRPYATTDDFAYMGGVIPYIGIETVTYHQGSSTELHVVRRKDIR